MYQANACVSPSRPSGPPTETDHAHLGKESNEIVWHNLHDTTINEASPTRLKSLRSHNMAA